MPQKRRSRSGRRSKSSSVPRSEDNSRRSSLAGQSTQESAQTNSAVPAPVQPADQPNLPLPPDSQMGKATQRPKQKKGGKVRGVDKGGTEMDAFVEPAPTPVAAPPARDPTPPPPREPTPPAPEPKALPVENSTAPVIEQLIQPEVESEETGSVDGDASTGTDMDAMVAAKNEENAKVSAAAAAAAANNNNNNITSNVEKEDGEVLVDGEVDEDESNDIKSMTIERTPSASQTLKYTYRDGQWSPVNREGKKVYDRDFLLEIKNSTLARQKPEFTLELDIFRDKPYDHPANNNRKNIHGSLSMGSRTDNPSPYRSSGSSSQRGPMMKMSGRPDRGGPQRIGPSISQSGIRGMGGGKGGYISVNSQFMVREPEPILHKDPNGWKPTRLADNLELTEEQKQIEKLQKNVRGILNKLTPQKFDKLVGKILELPIDSEGHLREMVNLVFEKAVDEPSFSKAYADLCQCLQKKATPRVEENKEITTPPSVTFRKLLLNKCQEGFEKNKKDELDIAKRTKEIEETPDPEKKKELKLLLEEEERKIRRKSVGLVRFIGELYKLHMLTPKIMHGCITTLLSQVAEESLECLCKLLTTIGKELERESVKKEFDEYFTAMSRLAQKSNDSKVSSRIRFMLQDVIELRQKNWKPRRDENNPKTLEQIHKDVEREAIESALNNSIPMHQGPKRHPGDGRRNPRSNQDSDGWQTSGNKYRTNSSYTNTLEPSKLQHFTSKSDAGDANFSLGGSGAFSQWTSGASSKRLGGLPDSSRSGPPPTNNLSANRFAPLGQAESTDSRMKYSSPMGGKGKGVSGSTSLEKDSRSIGGMYRERDRDDNMRRMGSGPSSRENSRSRYAQPGHSPAGSLNSRVERDYHRSEHPSSRGGYQDNREATESRVPPASAPDLDESEGMRKADTIFDEWCANNNAEETLTTVGETFVGSNNIRLLVRSLLNKVMEGKPHSRSKFADLLVVILQDKKICSKKDVLTEFQSLIDIGDDMVVDIPFFWSFFGQIFAPLVSNEVISIDDLKESLEERPLENRAKVAAEVFKALQQNETTSVWTSSKAKLTDFVPDKEIDDFVESNNFWFLTGNAEPAEEWKKHRDNLAKILQADSDKAMDEAHAFLAKIEGTVSKKAFIEIVTMAVIKASLKDDKLVGRLINKFDKLILKYVDNTEELELICLFAIKKFVVTEATVGLTVLTETTSRH
ncbi:hypothetical protein GE061_007941 [Apolygus lucorum]|uniref:MI domain-containing protein n=1 Tax=Apolygus lucorum TaxID=248454 RepID=A0A8S9WPQ0_APOLU|nr:hypothetical protein GE061_007941 [Apolygus lucorum]